MYTGRYRSLFEEKLVLLQVNARRKSGKNGPITCKQGDKPRAVKNEVTGPGERDIKFFVKIR